MTSTPSNPWRVPFNDLRPALAVERGNIEYAIRRVLDSGTLILGPEVEAFEREFATEIGYAHGIGVASGTDAVELALRAFLKQGSDVLTVANSAPATVSAIKRAGMNPVFCEIRPDGLMDANLLGHFMTPNTKAIVPVDLYGRWPDYERIMAFANNRGLAVIEDAAQAYGSVPITRPLMSDAICYSFYPTKALGALGDGGMILTNNERASEKIRALRFYGIPAEGRPELRQSLDGCNSRLDELQAAILRERMRFVRDNTDVRRIIAKFYHQHITDQIMPRGYDMRSNYHLFTINVENRTWFRANLTARGIQTAIHYPTPAHKQWPTQQLHRTLPLTEAHCATTLSLPCYYGLREEEVSMVAAAVNEVYAESEKAT